MPVGQNFYQIIVDGKRACKDCGEVKTLDNFHNNKHGLYGKMAACIPCVRVRKKKERERYGSKYRNRELDRQYSERRRVKTQGDDITRAGLIARDGILCNYCKCETTTESRGWQWIPNKATVDHVIPLIKGGLHTWDNVVLACAKCNASKGAQEGWR